jgi:hypothetical protein
MKRKTNIKSGNNIKSRKTKKKNNKTGSNIIFMALFWDPSIELGLVKFLKKFKNYSILLDLFLDLALPIVT